MESDWASFLGWRIESNGRALCLCYLESGLRHGLSKPGMSMRTGQVVVRITIDLLKVAPTKLATLFIISKQPVKNLQKRFMNINPEKEMKYLTSLLRRLSSKVLGKSSGRAASSSPAIPVTSSYADSERAGSTGTAGFGFLRACARVFLTLGSVIGRSGALATESCGVTIGIDDSKGFEGAVALEAGSFSSRSLRKRSECNGRFSSKGLTNPKSLVKLPGARSSRGASCHRAASTNNQK